MSDSETYQSVQNQHCRGRTDRMRNAEHYRKPLQSPSVYHALVSVSQSPYFNRSFADGACGRAPRGETLGVPGVPASTAIAQIASAPLPQRHLIRLLPDRDAGLHKV